MKIRHLTRKAKHFVNDGIWELNLSEFSRMKARLIDYLRVLIKTIKDFSSEKIDLQSVALSYYCLMAVVPLVAVIFGISDGLGLSDFLRELLYTNFPQQKELMDTVLNFANNIIHIASSGWVGAFSALAFVWLILRTMICTERVFNSIWKVEKKRNYLKRLTIDITITILSPLLVVILFSGPLLQSHIFELTGLGPAAQKIMGTFLGWLSMYLMTVVALTSMYKYIPACKVRFMPAFCSSLIVSFFFMGTQFIYLESQIYLTRFSAVYGTLAAIPLFMAWMSMSWYIILFGCELCYAYQSVKANNQKSTQC